MELRIGLTTADGAERQDLNFTFPFDLLSVESITRSMSGSELTPLAEIRVEAQGRSRRLFASHSELRAILDRHEATIQKRWFKKTKNQRQAILLAAWPNMATTHRPDLEALRSWGRQNPGSTDFREAVRDLIANATGPEYREPFIWPYINQEDLSKPKTLPLLLNARGRHDPCDFAAADGEAMRLGMTVCAIKTDCYTQSTMVLNGAVDPEEYGGLLAWDEHPDAYDWSVSRKQFQPAKGLLILEAQERLFAFLVTCCKHIMHDIPVQTLTSDAFSVKPQPQLKTEVDTNGFHSLAIMTAEAPYRVPEHLDFGRIESLLAAQESATKDHMWSLREDPGYFASTQQEMIEHRQEMIKDDNGKPSQRLDRARIHIFRAEVIGFLVVEAHIPIGVFSDLRRQAQELRALQAKYATAISPSGSLPKEYLHAILHFRYYLREAAHLPMTLLKHNATASPPLRRFFVRYPPTDAASRRCMIGRKEGIKADRIESKLLRALDALWDKGSDVFFLRLPLVMDELDRLVNSEQRAKDLVSPYLARIIGELSIITQCYTQLELYQPWASGFDFAAKEYGPDIDKEWAKAGPQREAISKAFLTNNLMKAQRLGNLSGGRFAYPVDKRRTRENTETLRQSEANLDAFWACIDELAHSKADDLRGTAVQRLLSQPRIIQRTPEWIEPIKEPKIVQATNQDVEALYKPLSALYFGISPSETAGTVTTLAKIKTKTKGIAKAPRVVAAAGDAPEDSSPTDPQPTIVVDARALKVFRTLFFNPSPTATPGEVAWNDFLHALTSTGFTAEKLYGSVWQFRPVTVSVDRSIQFHEPHPSGKIPFRDARRHGRRLNRAYGWCGDMFVLKEK